MPIVYLPLLPDLERSKVILHNLTSLEIHNKEAEQVCHQITITLIQILQPNALAGQQYLATVGQPR